MRPLFTVVVLLLGSARRPRRGLDRVPRSHRTGPGQGEPACRVGTGEERRLETGHSGRRLVVADRVQGSRLSDGCGRLRQGPVAARPVPGRQVGAKSSGTWRRCTTTARRGIIPRTATPARRRSPTANIFSSTSAIRERHVWTSTARCIWRQTDLSYEPVHGNGGSPILVDDLLVFSIDGSDKQCVVALDTANGKVKWQTDRKSKASRDLLVQHATVDRREGTKADHQPGQRRDRGLRSEERRRDLADTI